MKKYIPNLLSIIRFFISFILLIDNKYLFMIIYIFIGLSDFLDGYIARKYNLETDLGAKLDSIADFLFYIIITYIFMKKYLTLITFSSYIMIFIIISIRLTNIFISKLKYSEIIFLHTYSNKISGLLIYLLPIILMFFKNKVVITLILIISLFAAIEELAIFLNRKNINMNIKSILIKEEI
ncbi:MAG: CDP-alcohol phosphatidyltransferase family protein [Bacillota bacterium]